MKTRGQYYPSPSETVVIPPFCSRPCKSPGNKRRRRTVEVEGVVSAALFDDSSRMRFTAREADCTADIILVRECGANKFARVEQVKSPGVGLAKPSPLGQGIDKLHDDLLVTILTKVSSSATSPADIINTMLTCRRFLAAARSPYVLLNASQSAITIKASQWCDGAHRFLKRCAVAGNVEACYVFGMICFYVLQLRGQGASFMARAAMESHAAALLSLAIIQFNGSGGTRKDKDLRSGFTLCARAASLGLVDAVRELGHCLQDGYGVGRNIVEGRRLLLEANAREAAAAVATSPRAFIETALQMTMKCNVTGCQHHKHDHINDNIINDNTNTNNSISNDTETQSGNYDQKLDLIHRTLLEQIGESGKRHPEQGADNHSVHKLLERGGCFLLSDFGCTVPPAKTHIANKFLMNWFGLNSPAPSLRLCSHSNCGRPETRTQEFRRCSACGSVNYCSRACQALDWKLRHKLECSIVAAWEDWDDHDHDDEDDAEVAADEILS